MTRRSVFWKTDRSQELSPPGQPDFRDLLPFGQGYSRQPNECRSRTGVIAGLLPKNTYMVERVVGSVTRRILSDDLFEDTDISKCQTILSERIVSQRTVRVGPPTFMKGSSALLGKGGPKSLSWDRKK